MTTCPRRFSCQQELASGLPGWRIISHHDTFHTTCRRLPRGSRIRTTSASRGGATPCAVFCGAPRSPTGAPASPPCSQFLVTVRGFPAGRPGIADLAEWLPDRTPERRRPRRPLRAGRPRPPRRRPAGPPPRARPADRARPPRARGARARAPWRDRPARRSLSAPALPRAPPREVAASNPGRRVDFPRPGENNAFMSSLAYLAAVNVVIWAGSSSISGGSTAASRTGSASR